MASTELTSEPPAPSSNASEPVDLSSIPISLNRAVYRRRSEYIQPKRARVKIGTWNVASHPDTNLDLASWFVEEKGVGRRSATLRTSAKLEVDEDIENPGGFEQRPGGNFDDAQCAKGNKIDLYVLGLQEVVDLNVATQYVSRVYTDAAKPVLERWKGALESALPDGYKTIATEQMSGLLLLVYGSPEMVATVSHVSTSAVGTGLLGMIGNKGSVSARIVFGETTRVTFINSHLASGLEPYYVDRRCWDVSQIESRTQFQAFNSLGEAENQPSEKIGDEDIAFWFGDLNFRVDDLPGEDVRRLLMLHTRGQYVVEQNTSNIASSKDENPVNGEDTTVLKPPDSFMDSPEGASAARLSSSGNQDVIANVELEDAQRSEADTGEFQPLPSEDPASLQATLDSLLPHDQLLKMMKQNKVFSAGWREGHITFLPSYKYDVGTVGQFDSSEKQRSPSWCDRILYRTRSYKEDYEKRKKDEEEAKARDEEMKARGLDHVGEEDDVLFEYQPDRDGDDRIHNTRHYDDYDEMEDNATGDLDEGPNQKGDNDRIYLEVYTSIQNIVSSDHKPVVSVFDMEYDAVVPELKAKVHAEVAKELDRVENEGRPGITIVIDAGLSTNATGEQELGDVVNFGTVRFFDKTTASLTVANTSQVPATFMFVDKPNLGEFFTSSDEISTPSYKWLTTSFIGQRSDANGRDFELGGNVTLEPGETVSVLLEVLIDDVGFARMLNYGDQMLEDVLVLRVVDGRDHFIPLRGIWLPTCIGRSVEELIRVPSGGIRPFLTAHLGGSSGLRRAISTSIPYDVKVCCSVPRELFKLTEAMEALTDRVIAEEQMLSQPGIPNDNPGWPFENTIQKPDAQSIVAVIDALDTDGSIHDVFAPGITPVLRLEAVSHAFLLFLQGLTDGIVTSPLWSLIDQASLPSLGINKTSNPNPDTRDPAWEADKSAVLDILFASPYHNIAFVFLTTALSRIIGELSPLSLADLDALRSINRARGGSFGATIGGIGSIGRRSLSVFRKSGVHTTASEALEALDRRQSRERRFAEIFGKIICRAAMPTKEKSKKAIEDKQRSVIELFLRREMG